MKKEPSSIAEERKQHPERFAPPDAPPGFGGYSIAYIGQWLRKLREPQTPDLFNGDKWIGGPFSIIAERKTWIPGAGTFPADEISYSPLDGFIHSPRPVYIETTAPPPRPGQARA